MTAASCARATSAAIPTRRRRRREAGRRGPAATESAATTSRAQSTGSPTEPTAPPVTSPGQLAAEMPATVAPDQDFTVRVRLGTGPIVASHGTVSVDAAVQVDAARPVSIQVVGKQNARIVGEDSRTPRPAAGRLDERGAVHRAGPRTGPGAHHGRRPAGLGADRQPHPRGRGDGGGSLSE